MGNSIRNIYNASEKLKRKMELTRSKENEEHKANNKESPGHSSKFMMMF